MRILVTGGAGFIGSHSVNAFVSEGHQVIVLDNLSSGNLENLVLSQPGVDLIEGDILEYPLLKELVQSVDAVLHLAAIVSVNVSIEEPIYTALVNTQGFLHVLQAINEVNPRIRLVYASSAAIYGDAQVIPLSEETKPRPLSPYALQKLQCEEYAALYQRLFKLNALGLRYFNVYGKGQDPTSNYAGVISRFIQSFQNHETLPILGDGYQSRDFIHVADITRANQLALTSKQTGVLNIATGRQETLLNVIDALHQGNETRIKIKHLPPRLGDIRHSCADITQARDVLGFEPSIFLREGVQNLLND